MTNYWIGDSIGTSWWSENPGRDSPPGRMSIRLRAAALKGIANLSVGGLGIHDPLAPQRPDLAYGVIDRTLPDGADTVVIALGANDLGSHHQASELEGNPANYGSYIYYLMNEMNRVDELAQSRAKRVLWQTILPVCAGGYCKEPLPANMGRGLVQWYHVGPWNARAREVNDWMKVQMPGRVLDVTSAFRVDENGWGDPVMYFDGLHPTQWGCARIADLIPTAKFDLTKPL